MYLTAKLVLCVSFLVVEISSSAIPMWEYLSRDEKMSYLYSMFANQVEEFCEFSEMNNCNKELLSYGLKKLKVMPEDHLDTMDPYQRGANTIIWGSMMDGHEMLRTTIRPNTYTTTTAKPNAYNDDQSYISLNDFETAASQTHEHAIYQPPPQRTGGVHYVHPDYATIKASAHPQYRQPPTPSVVNRPQQYNSNNHNNNRQRFQPVYIPISNTERDWQVEKNTNTQHKQAVNCFESPNNCFGSRSAGKIAVSYQPSRGSGEVQQDGGYRLRGTTTTQEVVEAPLTGPMVVRVHLDGTPVRDDKFVQLPQDEDLRQYKMSKAKLPSF